MRVDTVADPRPGPAEVVVRVEAAGVNPADHKFRSGALAPFAPKTLPLSLAWISSAASLR
jgi:NADPH2:quinone reductase